jgi:leader peptidase (prepilin peptidase)/N-methyltransferase
VAAITTLQTVTTVWFFALGCAVGSFLNVLIYRVPRGLTVNEPKRSFCPGCEAPIAWYDNIPLLSFLALKGRCRRCGMTIAWRYPLVEALTGLLFALIYWRQAPQAGIGQVIIMVLLASILVAASAIDMEWLIIPDELSFFGLLGGLLAGLLLPELHVGQASYHTFAALTGNAHLDGLIASGIGALGGGLIVLGCAIFGTLLFRKEAMGFGDVKLMAMVGAFFGWKVALLAFFISPFVGLLYGLPLLMLKGEHVMPYGPFLSIGTLATLIFRTRLCEYLEPLEQLAGLIF